MVVNGARTIHRNTHVADVGVLHLARHIHRQAATTGHERCSHPVLADCLHEREEVLSQVGLAAVHAHFANSHFRKLRDELQGQFGIEFVRAGFAGACAAETARLIAS